MRYHVLGFLCVVAGIAYIQRAALSVPANEISRDFAFADLARDMGYIQSAWYLGYAVMQIPSGWTADRVGSRSAIAGFCVLWSTLTLLSGFATGFVSLLVVWCLMGMAQAGAFPCAAKAIGQMFTNTERARASGILASGMAIGGAIAPLITAAALEFLTPVAESWQVYRWRLLLAGVAVPGVLWTICFLVAVPATVFSEAQPQSSRAAPIDWNRLFRSKSLALLCAQQFFRAAAMVFFLTWFPTFLQKTRGVSSLNSGVLTTIAGMGGVLGSLSGGFCSDWLLQRTGNKRLSRQGIAVVGMASCAVLIAISYFIVDTRTSITAIAAGAFCATFGGVSGYTVAIDFGGRHVATVFSTMNMCGNFGATLFPITAGWLVATTGNWNLILFLFAAIMAVDAVCWAVLNPQGTLFGDSHESN
jgi:ACS family D-galactonate transporter-like MFS transporter